MIADHNLEQPKVGRDWTMPRVVMTAAAFLTGPFNVAALEPEGGVRLFDIMFVGVGCFGIALLVATLVAFNPDMRRTSLRWRNNPFDPRQAHQFIYFVAITFIFSALGALIGATFLRYPKIEACLFFLSLGAGLGFGLFLGLLLFRKRFAVTE